VLAFIDYTAPKRTSNQERELECTTRIGSAAHGDDIADGLRGILTGSANTA